MDKEDLNFRKSKFRKRWTPQEDARLARQVRAFPQNLHKCFVIVAEELGRTQKGVEKRWYTKVSHDFDSLCFIATSFKKNKGGVRNFVQDVWIRLINIIKKI